MLKGKDLLSIHDLSTDEVAEILDCAEKLKVMQKSGIEHKILAGKTLGKSEPFPMKTFFPQRNPVKFPSKLQSHD